MAEMAGFLQGRGAWEKRNSAALRVATFEFHAASFRDDERRAAWSFSRGPYIYLTDKTDISDILLCKLLIVKGGPCVRFSIIADCKTDISDIWRPVRERTRTSWESFLGMLQDAPHYRQRDAGDQCPTRSACRWRRSRW